jgi:hypothetical protein
VQLPDSCTFEDYVDVVPAPCRLQFAGTSDGGGATSLLQSEGTLYFDVHRCSGGIADALPSVAVAYSGQLEALADLKPCDSDSDCSAGTVCVDLMHLNDGSGGGGDDDDDDDDDNTDDDDEDLFAPPVPPPSPSHHSRKGARDPLGLLLFGRGGHVNGQCSSKSAWRTDVRNMVLGWGGRAADNGNSTSFCWMNTTVLTSKRLLEQWAQANVNLTCIEGDVSCIDAPITVAGLQSSDVDVNPDGNAPQPTDAPAPSTAASGQQLVTAVATVPVTTTPQQFLQFVSQAFKNAVVQAMADVWSGLSTDNVYIVNAAPHAGRRLSRRSRYASGAVNMLSVSFTMNVPDSVASNATESMAADGAFTQSFGRVLEGAGVIPPGTAGDVTVQSEFPDPQPSSEPHKHSHGSNTAAAVGGGVAAGVVVAAAAVVVAVRRRRAAALPRRAAGTRDAANERTLLLASAAQPTDPAISTA